MNILRIVLTGEEPPHYTITNAFIAHYEHVDTIWWQQYNDIGQLNELIQHKVTETKYDVIFMQVQTADIITDATAIVMCNSGALILNWTGDVRNQIDWYLRFGKHCVTLFTNNTDVDTMRKAGFRSEYFQIGYDDKYYFPPEDNSGRIVNIVMCANYYPAMGFPLTPYRINVAHKMKTRFPQYFNLYGTESWKQIQIFPECIADNMGEANVYRKCGIALSVSHYNYKNYFSDRLLREMACGAFVLSHRYQNCDEDFENGKHLVFFDNADHLVELCNYYLVEKTERERIGAEGAKYVAEHYTWPKRLLELDKIIHKHINPTS